MINSISLHNAAEYTEKVTNSVKEEKSKYNKKHTNKNSNTDSYQSSNRPVNIKRALAENDRLTYTEPTKILGITLRDGFYTYKANGKESIGDIKKKFGIPDKAIEKMNNYIKDDGFVPDKDKEIYFQFE